MKKATALGFGAVLLGGCALPVPLQVASWALDGISYLATEKSVTDHGISIVAQQDCAMWRGVTEGELCRQGEQGETLVAEAERKAAARRGFANAVSDTDTDPSLSALSNFETAAGGSSGPADEDAPRARLVEPVHVSWNGGGEIETLPELSDDVASTETQADISDNELNELDVALEPPVIEAPAAEPPMVELAAVPAAVEATPVRAHRIAPPQTSALTAAPTAAMPVPEVVPVVAKAQPAKPVTLAPQPRPVIKTAAPTLSARNFSASAGREPAAGIYFVIGSFRNHANARSLVGRHAPLTPAVLAAKLDGGRIYRVVVGPVDTGAEKDAHRRLSRAGLADTWAIRVTPGDWSVAMDEIRPTAPSLRSPEVAGLPR